MPKPEKKRLVVIGGGPAGIAAIEAIRDVDRECEVTLVSAEPPYARMVLPYWISGDVPEEQILIADDASLARLGVTGVFGRKAAALQPQEKSLTLDDGTKLSYDELLIATGSRAIKPDIPGLDKPGVTCLWSRDDARTAIERLAQTGGDRAALLGAGFIGFIILNALHKKGCSLTVIEREGQVLPRMLDRQGAAIVEAWLRERGITVHTGASLEGVGDAEGGALALKMGGGASTDVDLLVVATGIRTNTDWLNGSGVRVGSDGGIYVDSRLRTTAPDVYAAGDCASGPDVLAHGTAVHPIQPTAVEHGRLAGTNMAGRDAVYGGSLLMNVLDVCGLHCVSMGRWKGEGDLETVGVADEARATYRKLVFEGDRLVGAILVGRPDDTTMLNDVGMLKGLIDTRTTLGKWKEHLAEQPHDLRRVYLATGAGAALARRMSAGLPARPRVHRHAAATPAGAVDSRGPHHAALVGALPAGYPAPGRTPVVGIGKPKA